MHPCSPHTLTRNTYKFKRLQIFEQFMTYSKRKHNTMKATVLLVIFFASTTLAQTNRPFGYVPDHSGRYYPDNEGVYIHDDSGRYIPDYSGLYHHIDNKYIHYEPSSSSLRPIITVPTRPVQYGHYDDSRIKIIKLNSDVGKQGFKWEYETENEIFGEEKAKVVNTGTKDETISSQGYYKYTGPDNIIYNVEYTADHKGFIPKADHLHPALQRALEIHAKGTDTLKDSQELKQKR